MPLEAPRHPTDPPQVPPARITYVLGLWLRGYSTRTIVKRCAEKYGVKRRTVEHYLERAKLRLRDAPKPDPAETLQAATEMLRETYELASRKVKLLVVPQGKGLPSEVQSFPAPDTAAMATCATRLLEIQLVPPQVEKIRRELDGTLPPSRSETTITAGAVAVYLPELDPLEGGSATPLDGALQEPRGPAPAVE